jgi:hypothetical protein
MYFQIKNTLKINRNHISKQRSNVSRDNIKNMCSLKKH